LIWDERIRLIETLFSEALKFIEIKVEDVKRRIPKIRGLIGITTKALESKEP